MTSHVYKSSSRVAQYVTLPKYFSHQSSVILPFSNPIDNTKIGTANRWETTISNPSGPMISQWEIGRSLNYDSHIIFITLFSGSCKALLYLLLASENFANMLVQNHLLSPTSMFWLFFIQFSLQDHKLTPEHCLSCSNPFEFFTLTWIRSTV